MYTDDNNNVFTGVACQISQTGNVTRLDASGKVFMFETLRLIQSFINLINVCMSKCMVCIYSICQYIIEPF